MAQKGSRALKKFNKDCNNTAGLEAKLTLAVDARVMLRRNVDTKAGLVNGAIGTVVTIASHHVRVKFDHLYQTFDIEKVKGMFMVMKNYYVYRRHVGVHSACLPTLGRLYLIGGRRLHNHELR